MAFCGRCRIEITCTNSVKNRAKTTGLAALCKECHKDSGNKWYKENTEKRLVKSRHWNKSNPINRLNVKLKKYGLNTNSYQELLIQQNYVCKICKKKDLVRENLSVDHCHKTGKVRGLLCTKCNTGLGMFDDSVEHLNEAILYLKEIEDDSILGE